MLKELSLSAFMDVLASDAPAPGGGSVSALNGAMAAALAGMVCRLSLKRAELSPRFPAFQKLAGQLDGLRAELLGLTDEDAEAFNRVMAAFRLPKGTEDEKHARSAAIQQAYKGAVEVPLRTAARCVAVAECAAQLAEGFNTNAESDLSAALACAQAGMQGGFGNVRINLPSLKDSAYVEQVRRELERLDTDMVRCAGQIASLLA